MGKLSSDFESKRLGDRLIAAKRLTIHNSSIPNQRDVGRAARITLL